MNTIQSALTIAERAASFGFETGTAVTLEGRRLEAEGRDIVHLNYGEPDFPTPEHIVAAAERALRSGITHYTPASGLPDVRRAIAADASRRWGVEVLPEQVVITSGSTQALLFTMLALVDPGDEVIVQDPCYSPYHAIVQLAAGVSVPVPMQSRRDGRLDEDRLRHHIRPATRMLFINSPNNPTGELLSDEDLERLAGLAERHDLWVLTDDVYRDLTYDRTRAPSIMSVPGMAARTISIDSFSKSYAMCGWRIGYAIAPVAVARRLDAMMIAGGLCAPSFAQAACVEALTSPASAPALAAMRDEFRRRRDIMVDGLRRIPGFDCHVPDGAFYAFPDITGTGMDDVEMAWYLMREAGVGVLPGSPFGEAGAGHLRLSYATSMDRIEESLRRMSEAMTRRPND